MKYFVYTSAQYLLMVLFLITLLSCKEETILEVSDAEKQFFNIRFDLRSIVSHDKPRSIKMYSYFTAFNTDVQPDIFINNTKIEEFYKNDGNVYGQHDSIPYTPIIKFSVSSGKKVTTGIFILPTVPYNVTCSGFPLTDSIPAGTPYTKIPVDSIFHFKWECNNYDYFGVRTSYGEGWGTTLFEKEFTRIKSNDWTHWDIPYGLFITAYKGDILAHGTKPPYTGTYGSGFVSAGIYSEFRYVPN